MFDTYILQAEKEHGGKTDRHLIYHILADLHLLINQIKKISMTQEELAAQLNAVADQADKSKTEILAEVKALEDQISSGQQGDGTTIVPTAALTGAIARLKASVQSLDDLNVDAPVTTPPVEPPPVETPVPTEPAPVPDPAVPTTGGEPGDVVTPLS